VDQNVRLEVLDWGGSGRPLVLLPGLSNTAHVFDDFAPKLTAKNHVYGITRRGFGGSSVPAAGYDADRLADDVLAVIDSLKLTRPVLAGHSLGGEELSSIGSRFPDRVAGLIYLDAVWPFAFDDGKVLSMADESKLPAVDPPPPTKAERKSFAAYQAWFKRYWGVTYPEAEFRAQYVSAPDGSVGKERSPAYVSKAILAGTKKFTNIRAPALAIIADPQDLGPGVENSKDPAVRAAHQTFADFKEKLAKEFENGVPGAHVVRLRDASHMVTLSNEPDVLREMNAFLATLK
jgi:pimeloyl-ACP methyl ester carboxylesterase